MSSTNKSTTKTKATTTTLAAYVDAYALERPISKPHAYQLRCTVSTFSRWLGRPLLVEELADALVNKWIVWMEGRELSPTTVRSQRGNLLSLWKAAHEAGLVRAAPRKVRVVRIPDYIPTAFSEDDARKLLAAAAKLKGFSRQTGLSRAAWWKAFVLVAWDTALRLGDVLTLTADEIRADGLIVRRMAKTGRAHASQLRPETIQAIEAMGHHEPGPIFQTGCSRDSFYANFRELAKAAGVTGTSKFLRRGSATACEKILPGSAMAHLGHKTPGLAYKHYVDPTQLQFNRTLPPSIAPSIAPATIKLAAISEDQPAPASAGQAPATSLAAVGAPVAPDPIALAQIEVDQAKQALEAKMAALWAIEDRLREATRSGT